MTEHKYTDDEIIKALECCAQPDPICKECPYYDPYLKYPCANQLKWAALNLIDRQKAEIERLKKIGDDKTSEVMRHDASIRELHKQLETAKPEAIKDFAEKLKFEFDDFYYSNEDALLETADLIDDLVKEMTEGKK